ncbi:response regulator [Patescibacteria group bacterium]|nr:response regulator [Patescibacteria group bacterium]
MSSQANTKILLVEDDQLLVRLYKKKLTKEGFAVVVARDGSDGLVKAKNDPPDMILLDLMMPKTNGFEMLAALQSSPQLKNIPVMVLTNVSAETDEQRARGLGATDYLVKADNPPDMVVERIKELLEQGESPE